MPDAGHLVLLGLMGTGKTSIGRRVADELGRPLVDGDVELERRTGRTAAAIVDDDGVETLHRLEVDVLLDALERQPPSVIGPAASCIEDERCREALGPPHVVVWLDGDADVLAQRAAGKPHRPPQLAAPEAMVEAAHRRAPLFEAIATIRIDVTDDDKERAAREILERLQR